MTVLLWKLREHVLLRAHVAKATLMFGKHSGACMVCLVLLESPCLGTAPRPAVAVLVTITANITYESDHVQATPPGLEFWARRKVAEVAMSRNPC